VRSIAELRQNLRALGWVHAPERDSVVSYEMWTNGYPPNHPKHRNQLIPKRVMTVEEDAERILVLARNNPGP